MFANLLLKSIVLSILDFNSFFREQLYEITFFTPRFGETHITKCSSPPKRSQAPKNLQAQRYFLGPLSTLLCIGRKIYCFCVDMGLSWLHLMAAFERRRNTIKLLSWRNGKHTWRLFLHSYWVPSRLAFLRTVTTTKKILWYGMVGISTHNILHLRQTFWPPLNQDFEILWC